MKKTPMKANSKEGVAPNRLPSKGPELGATTSLPSASVPITIYRELAAELQQTQVQLREMAAQKELLIHQNQQLRDEIEQIVKAVLHGRDVASGLQPDASPSVSHFSAPAAAPSPHPVRTESTDVNVDALTEELMQELTALRSPQSEAVPSAVTQAAGASTSLADSLLVKPSAIKMPSYPRPLSATQASVSSSASAPTPRKTRWIKGWSLPLVILLVVVTAFGAGFTVTLYLQNRTTHQAN